MGSGVLRQKAGFGRQGVLRLRGVLRLALEEGRSLQAKTLG